MAGRVRACDGSSLPQPARPHSTDLAPWRPGATDPRARIDQRHGASLGRIPARWLAEGCATGPAVARQPALAHHLATQRRLQESQGSAIFCVAFNQCTTGLENVFASVNGCRVSGFRVPCRRAEGGPAAWGAVGVSVDCSAGHPARTTRSASLHVYTACLPACLLHTLRQVTVYECGEGDGVSVVQAFVAVQVSAWHLFGGADACLACMSGRMGVGLGLSTSPTAGGLPSVLLRLAGTPPIPDLLGDGPAPGTPDARARTILTPFSPSPHPAQADEDYYVCQWTESAPGERGQRSPLLLVAGKLGCLQSLDVATGRLEKVGRMADQGSGCLLVAVIGQQSSPAELPARPESSPPPFPPCRRACWAMAAPSTTSRFTPRCRSWWPRPARTTP